MVQSSGEGTAFKLVGGPSNGASVVITSGISVVVGASVVINFVVLSAIVTNISFSDISCLY